MKKNFNFIFAAFAAFALLLSCAKEEVDSPVTGGSQNDQQNVVEPVTISATLSDALTKVGFTPSYENGKPVQMALAWEEGDLLRVYNHDDRSKFDDFALDAASIGQKKGNFTGTPVNTQGATVYDVEVVAGEDFSYSAQTQPSDGVTTGLKYLAGVSGVASYSAVEFTDFSSVLAVTVKMPEGVAASVKSVDIKASENIFDGSYKLTVTLAQAGDAGEDGIVHFFATLPQGSTVIPSGTTLVAHINVPDTDHTIYTRFVELGSDLSFVENKLNTININATGSANYANASVENIGTEANPYLVGDKYQFDAMRNYISADMPYFEMIDDIDMTGIAWNPLITNATNCIHFDGNDFILSNVTSAKDQNYQSIFGCLNGTVQNLKVDKAVMVPGGKYSGVLASHLGAAESTVKTVVKDVIISNSTLGTAENKGTHKFGILAGGAENGNGAEVSNITISDCSVATTNYAGGMIAQTGCNLVISGTNQVVGTDVYGSLAGGVIGFANSLITMSGCTYSDGTVTATSTNSGCMIGSTKEVASVISDCHVRNAVIDATAVTAEMYCGGFIGRLNTNVTVKGCSVGTEDDRVLVKLGTPAEEKRAISGGFAGLAYGKITKNGDVRNKAYVEITCTNTENNKMCIGGFVGFHQYNVIEYCDADVVMNGLKGTYIGGFCGVHVDNTIQYCTVAGSVSGGDFTGGFVGEVDAGTISNCTAAGTLTTTATTVGGFIGGTDSAKATCTISNNSTSMNVSGAGYVGGFVGSAVGTYTSNSATGNVTSTGSNVGGFAGRILDGCTASFSRNYATGDISVNNNTNNLGGLIGYIGGNFTMDNCFATGNVGSSNASANKTGGLVGFTLDGSITEGITITNCYSSGNVYGRSVAGGLIGRMGLSTVSMSNSVAWNPIVESALNESTRYSSAAVVGTAYPTCTLTNNYRKPDMSLTAIWVPDDMTTFQHADVSPDHPLTDRDGEAMTDTSTGSGQDHHPIYPYHGKVDAGKTLSALARDVLGWSPDIWDFSGDLPVLK